MPRVTPYTEQVQAQGHNADFQDPSTADAGLGAAARSIGNSVGRLVQQHQQLEDDQGKMWAANATAQNEVQQQQVQKQRVDSLDPSAPDYVDQVNALPETADSDYQASTQALMEAAPNNAARKYVTMHAAGGRVRTMSNAIDTSANLNASYSVSQVDQATKSNSDIIAGSPDNGTFDDINGRQRQTIMDLQTIDPTVKLKLADQATHALSLTQIQAAAANNPTAFLQSVNAQGGVTTARGVVKGAVPGNPADATAPNPNNPGNAPAQPELLSLAQKNLSGGMDAGTSIVTAMKTFHEAHPEFNGKDVPLAFTVSPDGKTITDNGVVSNGPANTDPQVQPLSDDAIAVAKPGLSGWDNLTWPEKVAAVRGAESAAGKGLAEDRGGLSRELKDVHASYMVGQAYPDIGAPRFTQENLVRVYGPDEGTRAFQQLQTDQQVGHFIAVAGTMPAAQRTATLSQMQPSPGTGFADANESYQVALRANQQVVEQQQKDPTTYAINHNISGAQPLDFSSPDTLASGLRQRTMVDATMQRDYGTKAQIFTPDEVSTLNQGISKLSSHDAVSYLGSMSKALGSGREYATAMDQLGTKNPLLSYAGNMVNTGATITVNGQAMPAGDIAAKIVDGDRILNGRQLDAKGEAPTMPAGSSANKFNENQFSAAFDLAMPPAAFQSPDATRSAGHQKDLFNAAKAYYVADMFAQGKSATQIDPKDVANAVQAVSGGAVPMGNGGTLIVPFGMKTADFQGQWQYRANAALLGAGHPQNLIDAESGRLRPINLDNGRYGFMNGTNLLVDPKTRQPVQVDYATPYAGPAPHVDYYAPGRAHPMALSGFK